MSKIEVEKEKCLKEADVLKKRLSSENSIYEKSQRMKALSHPTRLKILEILTKKDVCVCVLTELTGKRQSHISQHLSLLRKNKLIEDYPKGRFTYYRLKDKKIHKLLKEL